MAAIKRRSSGALLLLSLLLLISISTGDCTAKEKKSNPVVYSTDDISSYGFEVPGSIIPQIGSRRLLQESTTNSSDSDGDDNQDDDDHETITLSHEAVAGIAVGVFFVVAFVVLAIYVCRTKKYVEQRRAASLARARAAEMGWPAGAGIDLEAADSEEGSSTGGRSTMPTPQRPLFPHQSSTGR